MIKTIISGAAGKMGRRIIACSSDDESIEIVGALEIEGHPQLGLDAGEVAGIKKLNVELASDLKTIIEKADLVIDFTIHTSTIKNLKTVLEHKKCFLIGTTGFSEDELQKIKEASKQIPILLSPNMSIGVNLLFDIVGDVAKTLQDGYAIEIVEAHHNQKKDAPSGTAKKLAEIIASATNRDLSKDAIYGRHGAIGARKKNEIGVHAIRAGDIVGEHTIVFAGAAVSFSLFFSKLLGF